MARASSENAWEVVFYTYSGMSIPGPGALTYHEALRTIAARAVARRKRGQSVWQLAPHKYECQWEDAGLVSDEDGILTVRREGTGYN